MEKCVVYESTAWKISQISIKRLAGINKSWVGFSSKINKRPETIIPCSRVYFVQRSQNDHNEDKCCLLHERGP